MICFGLGTLEATRFLFGEAIFLLLLLWSADLDGQLLNYSCMDRRASGGGVTKVIYSNECRAHVLLEDE